MTEQNHLRESDADPHAGRPWQTGHDVEFYGSDALLIERVADFLAAGVTAGQPIIVIATPEHRNALATALRARSIDIDALIDGRDRVWLDAEETLTAFMDGDSINRDLFFATVGNLFGRLKRDRAHVVVRAYGESVDLLWRTGKSAAALELERLWNELAQYHDFWLLCAYSHESLAAEHSHDRLHGICAHHRHATAREPEVLQSFPQTLQARLRDASM